MSFRLERTETLEENIRRLLCERIDCAIARFKSNTDETTAIHSVRKDVKKMRALLRLVREPLGEKIYGKEMRKLRDVAAFLAPVRDAAVKLNTFKELSTRYKANLPATISADIRKALASDKDAARRKCIDTNCPEEVETRLRGLQSRLQDWKIPDEWHSIACGVRMAYKGGRECLAAAAKKRSAADFHESRKRVKDLWYQTLLLRPVWPPMMKALADELEMLGELLGNDHDLDVLLDSLTPFLKTKDLQPISAIVGRDQHELRAKALAIGARIFDEKPTAFCQRLENYWNLWRSDKILVPA